MAANSRELAEKFEQLKIDGLSESIEWQPIILADARERIAKAILAQDDAPLDAYQLLVSLPTGVLKPEFRNATTLGEAYGQVMRLICAEVFPACNIRILFTDELHLQQRRRRGPIDGIPHLPGEHAFLEAQASSTVVPAHCGVVNCYVDLAEWEFPERIWASMYQQCHALAIIIGRIHIAEEPNRRLVNIAYEQRRDYATLIMRVFGEE